jgi:hypothetical protein
MPLEIHASIASSFVNNAADTNEAFKVKKGGGYEILGYKG